MRTFCTIITSNYFPYATALYRSLIKLNPAEKLIVLVCDDHPVEPDPIKYPGITIINIDILYGFGETDILYHKYAPHQMDAFRWSMKSVLLRYLLEKDYEKAIYVDCDIFFFNDYEFLFSDLEKFSVLLSPCWRSVDPFPNNDEFLQLYTDGLYNAGFVGANKNGIVALTWWTQACLYKVEIGYNDGLFVDQKYLDAMPLMFENISSVKHKGCNIAFWNQNVCKRIYRDGTVLINGTDPIIFIHFSNKYIAELLEGHDQFIFPYFQEYECAFEQSGRKLNEFINDLPAHVKPKTLQLIKRKMLLRTRLKSFLHKLVDRI